MNKIDVSKCAFYDNGKCNNPNGMACNCCNNVYCYYKQLQQLKAENETLNTLFKNYKKEYIDSTNKLGEMVIKNGNLYNEKEKYKHCLNEIEGMARSFHLSMIMFHKGATHEMADRIDYYLDEILQLIKQAKEGVE